MRGEVRPARDLELGSLTIKAPYQGEIRISIDVLLDGEVEDHSTWVTRAQAVVLHDWLSRALAVKNWEGDSDG